MLNIFFKLLTEGLSKINRPDILYLLTGLFFLSLSVFYLQYLNITRLSELNAVGSRLVANSTPIFTELCRIADTIRVLQADIDQLKLLSGLVSLDAKSVPNPYFVLTTVWLLNATTLNVPVLFSYVFFKLLYNRFLS